jgi:uncharacterized protein (DUF488 family)
LLAALLSVGHGARPLEAFLDLVQGSGAETLVDIRSFPGSRRHPQFGQEALSAALADRGVAYEWIRPLGGFRKARPDSPHTALSAKGFRGYADHMQTDEFRDGLDRLIGMASEGRLTIMCAESLWWRCHRRMVSDALAVAGCAVEHLMEGGRVDPHRVSSSARVVEGALVYDVPAGQQSLLPPQPG